MALKADHAEAQVAARLAGRRCAPPRRCNRTEAIKARWTLHTRFGRRSEALELVQEWVESVASQTSAELQAADVAVGAIGAPDCMLQLDLQFPDIAALETFWHTLPAKEHKAWLQRIQAVVSEHQGGPAWTVFHTIPCHVNASQTSADTKEHITTPTSSAAKNVSSHSNEAPPAAAALSAAITSQLSHPAIAPAPSILDLPATTAAEGSTSIVLPGAEGFDDDLPESSEAAPRKRASKARRRGRSKQGAGPQESPTGGADMPLRVGGGIKIAAGGAPAGSRLAAMVGDTDYFDSAAEENHDGPGAGPNGAESTKRGSTKVDMP
eukprot:jgi/Ulvmu1/8506/UM044_0040.1